MQTKKQNYRNPNIKTNIMKEITLKELSVYLPHRLKIQYKDCSNTNKKHTAFLTGITSKEIETTYPQKKKGYVGDIISFKGHNNINDLEVKPILRDLSDLTREDLKEEILIYFESLGIDVKIVKYDSGNDRENDFTLAVTYRLIGETFTDILINRGSTKDTPRHFFNWLCENKFNVFQLPDELIVKVTEDFNPYK